jgi:hypothetical protein
MTADLDKMYEATQAEHARSTAERWCDRARPARGPPPSVWADIYDLMQRYRKTRSTVDRWLNDPALNFPRPVLIRGKRLWKISELDAFDERLHPAGRR